jgi:hypothetical protein
MSEQTTQSAISIPVSLLLDRVSRPRRVHKLHQAEHTVCHGIVDMISDRSQGSAVVS